MVVSEIMTHAPLAADVGWTVRDALRTLHEEDFRHLPVLGEENELLGIVSLRDLQVFMAPTLLDAAGPITLGPLDASLGDVMSGSVEVAHPEMDVKEAIERLLEYRIGALPVVEPTSGDLVGIVSYVDVLRAVSALV
jgi:acetoin utilization protein AcuB